jgi:septum formation protein
MPASNLVLASTSPRRRQLLALTGRTFSLQPASIDERPQPGEKPGDYVLRLAREKARAAGNSNHGGLYLGSDTTVALGDEMMGKPADAAEAAAMLRKLRGLEHTVYTAVALFDPATQAEDSELCATSVPMRAYSDEEITAYVDSGDPLDKAGAYAIQHAGFHPVEALSGCYASVMGLPLCHLERLLRRMQSPSPRDVPAGCQAELAYDCPVWKTILRT